MHKTKKLVNEYSIQEVKRAQDITHKHMFTVVLPEKRSSKLPGVVQEEEKGCSGSGSDGKSPESETFRQKSILSLRERRE